MERIVLTLTMAAMLLLPWSGGGVQGLFAAAAWADDHDDDDDDDDDDDRPAPRRDSNDDDDDRPAPRAQTPAPRAPVAAAPRPAPAPPPPTRAPDEIVVIDLALADLASLLAQGFALIEQRDHPGLGIVLRRLRAPDALSLEESLALVRGLPSGGAADFNHYYRTEQDAIPVSAAAPPLCEGVYCPALAQTGWPAPQVGRAAVCAGTDIVIGMVDTGLNADHATFDGARLDVLRLADEELDPSRAVHGTAVASLLLGDPASRSPGLMPHARLIAVDVFHRDGSDERADAFVLADGIAYLVEEGARVINLSLAGPDNALLADLISWAVAERGVVIVAAAGNDGPSAPPAFPAAWPGVIAVTAVSPDDRVYRRAGQGDHIDLAAPGVDVWTAASVEGARPKTGTSFAAPFVAAAAALVLQRAPELTPEQVAASLALAALDLGDPGPDPVFGSGMVQFPPSCGPLPLAAPGTPVGD